MKDKIAIVGAGIAGLALAILATEQGHNVTVYEKNSAISNLGAGITLWPNAMFVISQMGLLEDVKRVSGMPLSLHSIDKYGNTQSMMNIELLNQECGYPSIAILRKELMQIFYQKALKLGVSIKFQHSVNPLLLQQMKSQFDLIVGADGRMYSTTRQLLFDERPQPQYQGFINIVGISQLDCQLTPFIKEYRGNGQRFGIVPVHSGWCYWAAAWRESLACKQSSRDWGHELEHRFEDWPPDIKNMIKKQKAEKIKPIYLYDLDPLPYWHQENILLIGDAAHASLPTSGQGACQALEDAWHLVTVLTNYASLDQALNAFYQQRIAKATAAQNAGRHVASQVFSSESITVVNSTLPNVKQLTQLWMYGLS
ncbi:FAD-dependent oxidoreductase [Pseudoalteromonas luteoviolacea]|uniref:FAD-binding domain-containing protein n=1 Tax=Pseudoalteromonas luteoviolacea NCIMB 1942 TaxID=1365253 RepID=A0A166Z666_9GAMM|nr:FAD-dependent oxidoreductase [Pseudoalteromonas luteoviolacea]KZN43977.1 hypothetical protein N482_18260 [Pseudoalteromonas luteoviolacea NCIMB 1942]